MSFISIMNNIIDWFVQNWGLLVFGTVILLFLFRKKIKVYLDRRSKEKGEELPQTFSDTLFPEQEFDIKANLFTQKKSIETDLKNIEKEGKALVNEEKKLDKDYRYKKDMINFNKQQLKIKYSMQIGQLDNVNQMVTNQEKMDQLLENK